LKKKVKAGADIVTAAAGLYATKGNKTDELWMYVPGAFAGKTGTVPFVEHEGVLAGRLAKGEWRMAISPNPLASGSATLSFTGALGHLSTGALSVSIYDASGRLVRQSAIYNLQSAMPLDLRSLPAGVYLVKLASDGYESTYKLVLQRSNTD
jgi:hypothetical protein